MTWELKNEELLRKNEELKYINNHDALTGLYNRKYFLEKLNEQIMDVSGEEEVLLILWNVDNLNGLNNTYGHDIGDQILVLLADRVKTAMGSVGVLSRLGGDEFAFAMKGMFHNHEFMAVAQRILDVCEMPLIIGDYTFHITVGMGVARYPLCSADPVILMKHADVAMRFTKDTGRETHISLYIDIDTTVKRKYRIGSYLKNCNLDDELELYFQPQFRMADRKLIGMEALLRWNSPEMGLVGPDEFIPVAEDENLIIPIGNWVIDNAVRQIAAWNHAYGKDLRMGINISPKQLDQVSLLSHLAETVLRCDAQFSWLDIEITESITLDNEDSAAKLNQYFKGEGMAISIDDFGTGYSSLGYLNILSFDRLKIAKPLIDKITVDESNRKIVGSIILLAQSLGLQTIAEGRGNQRTVRPAAFAGLRPDTRVLSGQARAGQTVRGYIFRGIWQADALAPAKAHSFQPHQLCGACQRRTEKKDVFSETDKIHNGAVAQRTAGAQHNIRPRNGAIQIAHAVPDGYAVFLCPYGVRIQIQHAQGKAVVSQVGKQRGLVTDQRDLGCAVLCAQGCNKLLRAWLHIVVFAVYGTRGKPEGTHNGVKRGNEKPAGVRIAGNIHLQHFV